MNENETKPASGHTVECVTYNGVELPLPSVEERNEFEVARIFTALEQIERADTPMLVISTSTTW
jgi:hypothetical protein